MMTHEEIDNAIAVMQAYKEGKRIEYRHKGDNTWMSDINPISWNFADYIYRIKPETHYRPFKSINEVFKAIEEHGDWIYNGLYMCKFNYVTDYGVGVNKVNELIFKRALELCTFEKDGTPFGVEEE